MGILHLLNMLPSIWPWSLLVYLGLLFFLMGDGDDPSVVLCFPHCLMGSLASRIISSVTPCHLVIKADPDETVKLVF